MWSPVSRRSLLPFYPWVLYKYIYINIFCFYLALFFYFLLFVGWVEQKIRLRVSHLQLTTESLVHDKFLIIIGRRSFMGAKRGVEWSSKPYSHALKIIKTIKSEAKCSIWSFINKILNLLNLLLFWFSWI